MTEPFTDEDIERMRPLEPRLCATIDSLKVMLNVRSIEVENLEKLRDAEINQARREALEEAARFAERFGCLMYIDPSETKQDYTRRFVAKISDAIRALAAKEKA